MNIDHRNPRLRRGFAFVALAAVLGLSAVGLTQCRMVDDTVTGYDGARVNQTDSGTDTDSGSDSDSGSGRSACEHQCKDKYKQCKRDEDAQHKINRRACNELPTTAQRSACKKAENDRHKEAEKQCKAQLMLCKQNCRYREGAGSAGR